MEKALWYLFVGTRGGKNRARLVDALSERPRNANQLSESLDLEYNTIRYHLEKLVDHDIVETGGDDYGELYFLTDRFERHREEFDRITDRIED
ncbi:winged helix-turn-helix domain-containing protein [Natronomonas gomsonensis]|jgi:DNA-binding transcriptional ArsR family regulator|uniref:winged helix-turn-helix domain-containing protein n=1 Tax=Natronomonas gomsonensis TaxID=1046043 RepID=UPI0020CA3C51|nr:winged helix-turn-helix domain-containing protein [Natronomonas gomsonensis]MCY4729154.1 winged helix-turn-helix domain-containing protein [Natronomonas gomsonensis]